MFFSSRVGALANIGQCKLDTEVADKSLVDV